MEICYKRYMLSYMSRVMKKKKKKKKNTHKKKQR